MRELARGFKDDADTLPILKDCATADDSRNVRIAGVQELVRGFKDDPGMFEVLRDRAENDPDEELREFAKEKLAELKRMLS
jgi:HEAT repeats